LGLGLSCCLLVNGFHLYIFFTILISGILFNCNSTGFPGRWEGQNFQLGSSAPGRRSTGTGNLSPRCSVFLKTLALT
jgi:hypothetical protein